METNNYQFTQVPTNLFILLDNNCRSMLFTLIQLSSFYADEEGWFFRTWEDLGAEANLSLNLCMATIQTLFNEKLIEARPVGFGKGKKPNYYKVNFANFGKYEETSIEDAIKNPDIKIRTVDYKGSNFKLNLVREVVNETVNNVVNKTVKKLVKSENNIDNINNIDNAKNVKNKENTSFEEKEINNSNTPHTYKDLMEYFLREMDKRCKDKTVEELNEIQEALKAELNEFKHIPNYKNIFPYFIKPSIEKKKEKLLDEIFDESKIFTTA